MSSRRSDVSGFSIAWGRPTGPPCPHTADCHERDDHPLSQTFGQPAGSAGDVVPAGTAWTQPSRPSLTSSSLHCRSSRRCYTAMNCASRRQLGADVVKRLPRRQRADVALDLRSLLAEELAAEGSAPLPERAHVVLQAFGRPADVAARYLPATAVIDPSGAIVSTIIRANPSLMLDRAFGGRAAPGANARA